jgi:hypothetical protein
MAGHQALDSRSTSRLLAQMSKVAVQPVVAAARVNVVGMSTFRGAALFIWVGPMIWGFMSSHPNAGFLGVAISLIVEYVAWAGLRRRGGPLQFGPSGGVIAVSQTTLFIVQVSHWTGRKTKLLGTWPREDVSMTPAANRLNRLRLFDLNFPEDEAPSRLELVQNRRKDETLLALFPTTLQL